MKIISKTSVIFLLAFILGALVFQTSQRVQDSEDTLRKVEKQIDRERDEIEVLQAEWEYLNRPQRLEELAKDSLQMQEPKQGAIVNRLDDVRELDVGEQGDMVKPSYKPASIQTSGGAL